MTTIGAVILCPLCGNNTTRKTELNIGGSGLPVYNCLKCEEFFSAEKNFDYTVFPARHVGVQPPEPKDPMIFFLSIVVGNTVFKYGPFTQERCFQLAAQAYEEKLPVTVLVEHGPIEPNFSIFSRLDIPKLEDAHVSVLKGMNRAVAEAVLEVEKQTTQSEFIFS